MAKIKSRIDYFKPTNLGTLATCNKLYKSAKSYFRQAQETNKPADWTKAKNEYEKFLKHNEADVDAFIEIGVACYNLKRTEKSLKHLQKAEKLKASTALLNYYLAKIYSEKKDWDRAIACLDSIRNDGELKVQIENLRKDIMKGIKNE